jgi:hypothetical protein
VGELTIASNILPIQIVQNFELTLRPDWEPMGLLEYVCEDNNRCAGGSCKSSDAK